MDFWFSISSFVSLSMNNNYGYIVGTCVSLSTYVLVLVGIL
jgi:hypothetical protein